MRLTLACLAIAAGACASRGSDAQRAAGAEQVLRAGEAFQQHRLRDARAHADSAVANPALSSADRAVAEHVLATLAWRFDHDFAGGREHFRRGIALPDRPATAWAGLAQLELAARRPAEARFGAYLGLGQTAGYFDLHYGHAVVAREEVIEQYGHRATLRFVSLDEMASNGFQTWAWDSEAAHGGWASESAIYEVRPTRAGAGLQAWARWVEHRVQTLRGDRLAEDSAADWARARDGVTRFLPGLSARLERDGVAQILAPLRARGLRGEALHRAFVLAWDGNADRSSIFGHEGRHAIDKRIGRFTPTELEYRAKLSQVAFAPVPRLAVLGILQPNAGDPTPHGQANERALRGLVAWMQAHAAEIRGLDLSLPLLPQATKLSDDQLRAAFRSLDPLAQ